MNTQPAQKPPLGIMPEYVWNAQRLWALLETISRYRRANRPIPDAWLCELARRITQHLDPNENKNPR